MITADTSHNLVQRDVLEAAVGVTAQVKCRAYLLKGQEVRRLVAQWREYVVDKRGASRAVKRVAGG
jgi:hypothetical protein